MDGTEIGRGSGRVTRRWVMHPIPLGLSVSPRSLAMQGCAMHFCTQPLGRMSQSYQWCHKVHTRVLMAKELCTRKLRCTAVPCHHFWLSRGTGPESAHFAVWSPCAKLDKI